MSRRRTLLAAFAILVLGAAVSPALAQAAPGGAGGNPPGGAGGNPGGGGGRPDFAQMREQMNQRMKELMGASDDEWKVLQPKIEQIQQLQRDSSNRGGMGMLFGRGGRGGGFGGGAGGGAAPAGGAAGDQPQSPIQQKSTDLQTALENKDAKPEEIKAKVAALREARAKAKAEVAKAQDGLRELVTVRQEGVLLMLGVLE